MEMIDSVLSDHKRMAVANILTTQGYTEAHQGNTNGIQIFRQLNFPQDKINLAVNNDNFRNHLGGSVKDHSV